VALALLADPGPGPGFDWALLQRLTGWPSERLVGLWA